MAGNITHSKVSIIADDPNYDILPSDWNANHVIPDSVPNITPTAAGDHINGKADGTWEKKTLAEEKAVLNPYALIGGIVHKQLWVGGWKPTLTSGCAASSQIEMGTNKNVYDYLAFDPTTSEYAYVNVPLPQDYTGGVVYFKVYWFHPATTTNFGVHWGFTATSIGNDDALDVADGNAIAIDDTGGTTSDLYISDLSSAVTIGRTPTAGKLAHFEVYRYPGHANDTLAVDAYLLGTMIWYPVR